MSQNLPPILGVQATQMGGVKSSLNITASGALINPAKRIGKISVLATGSTGGPLVLNDSATVVGASTPNEVLNIAQSSLAQGYLTGDFPLISGGLVVSSMPPNCRISIGYD